MDISNFYWPEDSIFMKDDFSDRRICFSLLLLATNLFLKSILLLFLLYTRQIWKTQLTLTIFLGMLILLSFSGVLFLICQAVHEKEVLAFGNYSLKNTIFE